MTPFLQKILAATGLTRRGHLAEATQAIRKALAGTAGPAREGAPVRPETASASASPAAPAGSAEVLDGLVREVEPIRQGAPARVEAEAEAETPAEAIVVEREPAFDTERTRSGRFTESSFTAAAGTRSFKLFEPDGFQGRALPLVVMLHGCTQDPDDFAAGTRMNELAQEQGLFVLYPAQAPRSNAHKCWNWFVPGDQRRGQGEPALLAGMTRHVMETHPVDADRVWVAGLSAGGAMAAILAREYPDLFAAAGVHSGLPPGAAHDVVSAFSAMKSGASGTLPGWPTSVGKAPLLNPLAAWPGTPPPEAVEAEAEAAAAEGAPVIVFHGDADSTVNAVNGHHVVDAALGSAPSQASREWGAPASGDGRAFTRTVYHPAEPGSTAASRAEHWVVHGAGHAWSGGDAAGSFTDSSGPDASREMLRFFAEHPRRRRIADN
ncbi:MAG: extracellular catalytic domain type 1 short-chain-length polyhydroxyalkanoate depolymerase [Caldimonas sp.]